MGGIGNDPASAEDHSESSRRVPKLTTWGTFECLSFTVVEHITATHEQADPPGKAKPEE